MQDRVENPMGNMVAKYIIVKDAFDMAQVIAEENKNEWENSDIVANAEVTRPYIMLGDPQEVESDIIREIQNAAIEAGICVDHPCGIKFIK